MQEQRTLSYFAQLDQVLLDVQCSIYDRACAEQPPQHELRIILVTVTLTVHAAKQATPSLLLMWLSKPSGPTLWVDSSNNHHPLALSVGDSTFNNGENSSMATCFW